MINKALCLVSFTKIRDLHPFHFFVVIDANRSIIIFSFPFFHQKYERLYIKETTEQKLTQDVQFDYAVCLIKSRYSTDIKKVKINFQHNGRPTE